MKKIFFILFFLPLVALSQVFDDFSDGNFTLNPTWSGNDTSFLVTNYQLQSNGPNVANSIIYLATPNAMISKTEWRFLIDLKFNPTATTFVRVYLTSDQANLKAPLNGYYIEIGQSTNDFIRFGKQTATTLSPIFTGNTNLGSGNIKVRVKVLRDSIGNWEIYSDKTGGNSFVSEGNTFLDSTYKTTNTFGVYCAYSTASRYNLYYFDDFYVGPIVFDTTRPTLNNVSVISSNQIDILFSEPVESITAQNVNNYSANNGIGNPILALQDLSNGALIHLTFQHSFVNGQSNSLNISNVKDIEGNTMLSISKDFVYYLVKQFDILINEIMADPDPAVGLPAYEYVELFNKTSFPLSLKGFKLKFGSSTKTFPDSTSIDPNGYLIITKDNAVQLFAQYGKVLGLFTNIYSLTNDGQTISLLDPSGNIISQLTYNLDWYHDNSKKDGGWSLEQIDPMNPCGEINNWKASKDLKGGTPGSINSVFAPNPDNIVPSIIRVGLINDSTIQIYFSESLDSAYLKNLSNYSINNGIYPLSIKLNGPDYKSIVLNLNEHIQPSIIYTLTISDTISDCVGNILPFNSTIRFALPEEVFANDIVINEILYNPKDDGVDFVELYNRSNKVLDLKTLNLSSFKNNILTETKPISSEGYSMFPGDYIVLTTKAAKVKAQYYTPNPNNFNEMASFPSFNNDSGSVVVSKKNGDIIDLVRYNDKMQFPLLNTSDGVSLERIDFDRPSSDLNNWNSASETVGFATPAYKNSQFSKGEQIDNPISIEPEVFSPDNDGYNDVVNINYLFDTPGYTANITIYDANGRLIKYLVKNELIGTTGTYSWNGINENNEKAKIGIYIIYFEVFDIKGSVKHYKKTCVLGAKL